MTPDSGPRFESRPRLPLRPGRLVRTFRARLALMFAALLTVLLLLLWGCLYVLVRERLREDLHEGVERSLEAVGRALRLDPDQLAEFERNSTVEYFRVAREGQGVIYQSEDWSDKRLDEAVPPGASREAWERNGSWTWSSRIGHRFLLDSRFVEDLPGAPIEIIVAVDTAPMQRTLSGLAFSLLLVVPVTAGLGLVGGLLMARRVLAPINAMAAKAREISAERLAERLPVDNPDDELGQLAIVINQTLARLEASFEAQRRFTADASHELRTPLTAIQSVGEIALRAGEGEREREIRRRAIGSMLEEVDRLTRLVDALLILTRGDAGAIRLHPRRLDLFPLASEAAELLHVLAEDKGQELVVEGDPEAWVVGDRSTLRHAILNLVENAIKYTQEGGRIRVVVVAGEGPSGEPVLLVEDNGPGIAAEHHQKIFDRFYRVATDRSSAAGDGGGSGLGLAIAQWAARANSARIELESIPGRGSRFFLIFGSRPVE